MKKSILFIHGAWLTPAVWTRFAARFTACGYACTAPAWPLMDGPAEQLRRHPPTGLAALQIETIVDHYERLIHAHDVPPVLVGHSFGGLIVQLLLDRGLGAAGIAIAPVPTRGILPRLAALRMVLPLLIPRAPDFGLLHLTQQQFSRNVVHMLPAEEREAAYRQHVVPAPARIFHQAVFGAHTLVNFANDDRAPLLFMTGENDRTIQPSMVASTYRLHRRSIAVTDFFRFPHHGHWLISEPGWEEIADAGIEWLQARLERF